MRSGASAGHRSVEEGGDAPRGDEQSSLPSRCTGVASQAIGSAVMAAESRRAHGRPLVAIARDCLGATKCISAPGAASCSTALQPEDQSRTMYQVCKAGEVFTRQLNQPHQQDASSSHSQGVQRSCTCWKVGKQARCLLGS